MPPPFSLAEMLGRSLETIRIVDVGALWMDEEKPPYHHLAGSGAATVVGFEAVKAECDRLNARGMRHRVFYPYVIGDGSARTFHRCNYSMTSSIYPPNSDLLDLFQYLSEFTQVVERTPVQTTRLDDVPEIAGMDYLKMDVQGAELDVLRGAPRLLGGTVVVQTEVEFVPMYTGQPLFADVDAEMRARGLMFHCFLGISGRAFKPMTNTADPRKPVRQSLWAEAVYVRDFTRLHEVDPPALLKMAAILHDVYESVDLAVLCLKCHDQQSGGKLWKPYLDRVLASASGRKPPR